jgi:hypothetical protein
MTDVESWTVVTWIADGHGRSIAIRSSVDDRGRFPRILSDLPPENERLFHQMEASRGESRKWADPTRPRDDDSRASGRGESRRASIYREADMAIVPGLTVPVTLWDSPEVAIASTLL